LENQCPGLFNGEKPDYSGGFQRPNLTMWEIWGCAFSKRH